MGHRRKCFDRPVKKSSKRVEADCIEDAFQGGDCEVIDIRDLFRRALKKIGIEKKKPAFEPMAPAGHKPRGTPAEYLARFEDAETRPLPEVGKYRVDT